jgi:hypothetical protein
MTGECFENLKIIQISSEEDRHGQQQQLHTLFFIRLPPCPAFLVVVSISTTDMNRSLFGTSPTIAITTITISILEAIKGGSILNSYVFPFYGCSLQAKKKKW